MPSCTNVNGLPPSRNGLCLQVVFGSALSIVCICQCSVVLRLLLQQQNRRWKCSWWMFSQFLNFKLIIFMIKLYIMDDWAQRLHAQWTFSFDLWLKQIQDTWLIVIFANILFTFDHSSKQTKQNSWRQLLANDLLSGTPRHMAQIPCDELKGDPGDNSWKLSSIPKCSFDILLSIRKAWLAQHYLYVPSPNLTYFLQG